MLNQRHIKEIIMIHRFDKINQRDVRKEIVKDFKAGLSVTRLGKKYGFMRFQLEQILREWLIKNKLK